MKSIKILVTACFLFFNLIVQAQNTSSLLQLMGSDELKTGWFIKPQYRSLVNDDKLNEKYSEVVGGEIGLVLNSQIYVGLSGYAKTSRLSFNDEFTTYGVGYGYGGILLGYTPFPNKVIHPYFGVIGGYGGAREYNFENYRKGLTQNVAGFYYLEPEVNIEVNFSKMVRLSLGARYRFVNTSNFIKVEKGMLNGIGFQAGIVVGMF